MLRFLALGAAGLLAGVLGSACSSAPSLDDAALVGAADLEAMATPGVDERALDRSVDPCVDFYAFACGGYIASLPPDTRDEMRALTQLQRDQRAVLDRVVRDMRAAPRTTAERQGAAFLESCLSTDDDGKTTAFLADFHREIRKATTKPELARILATMHRRGLDPFFSVMPSIDTQIAGRHGYAGMAPGGFDWFTDFDIPVQVEARIRTIADAILAGEPALGDEEATRIAARAVTIEAALLAAGATLEPSELPHPIGRPGLEAALPSIDWDAYFRALGRADLAGFSIAGLGFFVAIDTLLSQTPAADVQDYLTARWFEAMTRELGAVPAARASFCTNEIAKSMSDAIEPRFLAAAGVDVRAQSKAKALYRQIVDTFAEQLRTEPFLDTPTRIEAELKLKKVRAAIGSSRTLDDFADAGLDAAAPWVSTTLRVRERAFVRALRQVGRALPLDHVDLPAPFINATYDSALNKVNVPGGILGGYFFSPSTTSLANFAAIGTVLGHELTHGFDNRGRHLDGVGVVRDWWSPAVTNAFRERATCLIDQYSAYTVDGVPDPHTGRIPARVSGKLTLAENIADNGGIKTAYRASKVEGRRTPLVQGFTPAQQFFVGYGQLWCAKQSPEVASQTLASDIHAPPRARVNIPLSNFDAFAAAFQCREGSPMAPSQRCSVW